MAVTKKPDLSDPKLRAKLAKGMAGDIVVFKDSNLYIIDVIFDTKKSYYLELKNFMTQ